MHGLINRAIQSFVTNSYGVDQWHEVIQQVGLDFSEFEPMLIYDDALTPKLLDGVAAHLARPAPEVLEDLGTYLVSHPNVEALRRLLRFGGDTYTEFLHSLDDLPDRARLAVSDLHLPALELREYASGQFSLICGPGLPGFGYVLCGILRVMADDYGALVILEHEGRHDGCEVISIKLVETAYAAGRSFDLGARAG